MQSYNQKRNRLSLPLSEILINRCQNFDKLTEVQIAFIPKDSDIV